MADDPQPMSFADTLLGYFVPRVRCCTSSHPPVDLDDAEAVSPVAVDLSDKDKLGGGKVASSSTSTSAGSSSDSFELPAAAPKKAGRGKTSPTRNRSDVLNEGPLSPASAASPSSPSSPSAVRNSRNSSSGGGASSSERGVVATATSSSSATTSATTTPRARSRGKEKGKGKDKAKEDGEDGEKEKPKEKESKEKEKKEKKEKTDAEGKVKKSGSESTLEKKGSSSKKAEPYDPKDDCPGNKMVKKVSYLQKIKEEQRRIDERAKEMGQFVDDMLAGKLQKTGGGGQPKGNMLIKMPSPYERKNTRAMFLEQFRDQYRKLPKNSGVSAQPSALDQYSVKDSQGLSIKDGHQHMPRPTNIQLPKDFRKSVGEMPLKTLQQHDCNHARILVSVYGDIFDVTDRPDKYGPDGPYAWMAGHDLTWGFLSGKDTPEQNDQLFDIWKMAPAEYRERKLQGVLAWVAFYEYEYGGAIGRLKEYQTEAGLKGPPMEEAEECCIM